jgi:hypothetical protein
MTPTARPVVPRPIPRLGPDSPETDVEVTELDAPDTYEIKPKAGKAIRLTFEEGVLDEEVLLRILVDRSRSKGMNAGMDRDTRMTAMWLERAHRHLLRGRFMEANSRARGSA